jgi:hypothetical protein
MDYKRLQTLLINSLMRICRKELNWKKQVRLQGLMCVTVDGADIVVVQIDEQILEELNSTIVPTVVAVDQNVKIMMPQVCLTRVSTEQLKSLDMADTHTLGTKSCESEQPYDSVVEVSNISCEETGYKMDQVAVGFCSDDQQISNSESTFSSGPISGTLTGDCDCSQEPCVKAEPVDEWFFEMAQKQDDVSSMPVDASLECCRKTEVTDTSTAQVYHEVAMVNETHASSSDMQQCYTDSTLLHHNGKLSNQYGLQHTDVVRFAIFEC